MRILGLHAERCLELVVHFVDEFVHALAVQPRVQKVVPGVLDYRTTQHLRNQLVPFWQSFVFVWDSEHFGEEVGACNQRRLDDELVEHEHLEALPLQSKRLLLLTLYFPPVLNDRHELVQEPRQAVHKVHHLVHQHAAKEGYLPLAEPTQHRMPPQPHLRLPRRTRQPICQPVQERHVPFCEVERHQMGKEDDAPEEEAPAR
mmetsp:Transcript_46126/g.114695  ORF Transcript_46126/g.114695 Transcript_46126/m.114695 type:complete len:202 (-) Transcript_46126:147-752(-)